MEKRRKTKNENKKNTKVCIGHPSDSGPYAALLSSLFIEVVCMSQLRSQGQWQSSTPPLPTRNGVFTGFFMATFVRVPSPL